MSKKTLKSADKLTGYQLKLFREVEEIASMDLLWTCFGDSRLWHEVENAQPLRQALKTRGSAEPP